jgi:uncharacterized protein YaeQ
MYGAIAESEKILGIDKYKVEDDLRTMKNYESIYGDKKRYEAVQHLAKSEMKSLAMVANGKSMMSDDDEYKMGGHEMSGHKMDSY